MSFNRFLKCDNGSSGLSSKESCITRFLKVSMSNTAANTQISTYLSTYIYVSAGADGLHHPGPRLAPAEAQPQLQTRGQRHLPPAPRGHARHGQCTHVQTRDTCIMSIELKTSCVKI